MRVRPGLGLLLLAAGCSGGDGDADGGLLDGGRNRPPCAVDRHDAPEQGLALALGTAVQGEAAICPVTDRDWYTFTVPADRPLVTIEVGYPSGATTPVELAYDLFAAADTERPLASVQDRVAGDNRSSISGTHFVAAAGGTYHLRVRDTGDDEQDVLNRYGVKVVAEPDNDPNEPNESCETAIALAASGGGAISFLADRDAFSFTVPAGAKIIDLRVQTAAATPVDLRASLHQGGAFLYDVSNPRGDDRPTDLRLRYGVFSQGATYCVVIEDDDGAEADPLGAYTVTLSVEDEPDAQEQAARNDLPESASDLSGGGQRTGYIASQNDLDWYRIAAPAGQIIEVELNCPGCTIQPAISLVYAHGESPCDGSSSCDYVLRNQDCNGDNDCASKICRDTPSGKRCAQSCGSNLDCASLQCNQAAQVSACVAAAVCTSGQCGILQYTDFAEPGSSTVRTAQPARAAVTHLLVHDFQDDEFTSGSYTLNVTITPDPDRNEPNNFYYPYREALEPDEVLRRGRDAATRLSWSPGPGARSVSGTGCIAYHGDVDIFRIQGGNPCAATSTTGMPMPGGHCGLSLEYSRPGGELDLGWFLYNRSFGLRAAFLSSAEGNDGIFGDELCRMGTQPECMFFYDSDEEDYYLLVRDYEQDAWDTSAARCYTWTLRSAPASGCPASCPTVAGNGLCTCSN